MGTRNTAKRLEREDSREESTSNTRGYYRCHTYRRRVTSSTLIFLFRRLHACNPQTCQINIHQQTGSRRQAGPTHTTAVCSEANEGGGRYTRIMSSENLVLVGAGGCNTGVGRI